MNLENLIKQLEDLGSKSSKLEPNELERNELIDTVKNFANNFINSLKEAKGYSPKDAGVLAIDGSKRDFLELLAQYQENVVETGIIAASGKHVGYIPGGGIFVSAIADFLAAVTNPYASVYYANPGAATIENEVVNWLKTLFSFPDTAVGSLSSGGSTSTLIAFTAARDHYKIKNELVPKSVVYMSEQVHHSTQKALRIIGLEDVIIRYIPLDDFHRMKADELDKQIKGDVQQGLNPFLIVASAGTTDTGAIDPLDLIADIAQKHQLWFHVDAAYGGFFILTSKKGLFKGIERADSLIVDPHKGMFLPYGTGAVLIKNKSAALHSNYYEANYMQDATNESLVKSSANISPELTKHFRGLRVWLPLQIHGIEPFIACSEEKLVLTQYFRQRLIDLGFKVGPEPDLSVSYFWYPFESDEEAKNRRLMDEIHKDGEVFLSSSIIKGRFVIRMAILSFRTKKETIDRAVSMIESCLAKVK
ncbi:MAG: aminotransferase class I/II-fold pyridoxal phosphate-dependent enzyme [Crocinitomicaceae bacterium]|nr:aminotransferase class I/II-fold pyridoxal phosphate-dependent enzyme [Crocinitomicaceae bacterium]